MPLAMARPWKHPKTGIFWLRRGVPADLLTLVGKREELKSLDTRDPDEARRRHAKAMVEVDERWASLRAGEQSLTEREANALAEPLFQKWVDLHGDDPSNQLRWWPEFFDQTLLTEAFDPLTNEAVEGAGDDGEPGVPIANSVFEPFGVKFVLKGDQGGIDIPFERVNVQAGEPVIALVERLCRMRNVHLFDDREGNVVGYRLPKGARSVADLVEGRNIKEAGAIFNYEVPSPASRSSVSGPAPTTTTATTPAT